MSASKRNDELIEKYDLTPVMEDVKATIDVPGAIATLAAVAAVVALIVAVLSWILANGLDVVLRVPFAFAGGLCSLALGLSVGAFWLSRQRFAAAQRAIARTLDAAEIIHADVNELRDGKRTEKQVLSLGRNLIHGVVFPAMDSAAVMLPLPKFVSGPLVGAAMWGPKRAVEKGVMSALESMDFKELTETVEATAKTKVSSTELVQKVGSAYQDAQSKIEDKTRWAVRVTQGALLVAIGVSLIPVVCWLVLAAFL